MPHPEKYPPNAPPKADPPVALSDPLLSLPITKDTPWGKGDIAEYVPKQIWKPNARAAGEHAPGDTHVLGPDHPDVAVRRFGSVKHLAPRDDALIAARRASISQSELGISPAKEKSASPKEIKSTPTVSHSAKRNSVALAELIPNTDNDAMISTINQCTGNIPAHDNDE